MKTIKIFYFVLVLSMLCPLISLAQRDVYNWQISPYAGLLTLNNDVEVPEGVNSFAYGLRVEKRLGNSFTFGLHLAQLEIDRASQNNVTGGFLSLAYHWDNGYLFSQRSAISIFHRLEAGYMDRYSTIESINGKSADVAFGFENGFKLRFGDRVSADIAVEILGTKSSVTEGDIAKNKRYNIWKVGLSYHFGSRKSNYVAPVFVPYDGIPFGSKMNKIERKDDNIWIANDSIYNSQLKEERFPEPPDDSNPVRTELSRADSLLIFMHFDSLYKRRELVDTTTTRADTTLLDRQAPKAIADTSLAKADTLDIGRVEKSLRDTIYMTDGDTISIISADTLSGQKTVESAVDTAHTEKTNGNKQLADSSAKAVETKTDSMRVDTVNNEKPILNEQKADTAAKVLQSRAVSARVDTVYMEKPVQKADTAAKALKPKSVPTPVDTVYMEKPVQKADTAAKALKPKSVPSPVDTVYMEKPVQKADTAAKALKPKAVPTRVDTVYMEKSVQKADTSAKALQPKTAPSRVDTLYVVNDKPVEKLKKEKPVEVEKADDEKANKVSETQNTDNSAEYQKSLDRQSDLLERQNEQIRDNQREIERLRKENRNSDAGKMIAAGAAGTALGATAASGNNQKPDTVYYESNAAQLKLDSLEQELTELKKQYGITDTIPAQTDPNYTPDPPIGMYFNADSTGTDSVGAASGDGTVLNSDSLRMQKDLLGLSDSLSADSLSRAEFADGILEPSVRSDEDEIRANSTIIEDKSSAQQDVEANPIVLIGNYPVVCNFGLNKTLLDAGELKKLDPVVADLKNDKTLKVFLTGYTDNSGNADYNLKLSKERAKSVMDYLIAEGVAADRIEVSGSGVLESADKFSSNARRVDVSISD